MIEPHGVRSRELSPALFVPLEVRPVAARRPKGVERRKRFEDDAISLSSGALEYGLMQIVDDHSGESQDAVDLDDGSGARAVSASAAASIAFEASQSKEHGNQAIQAKRSRPRC